MLWGWLRRRRFERLLSRSEDFVGREAGRGLTPKQRARELNAWPAPSRPVIRHAPTATAPGGEACHLDRPGLRAVWMPKSPGFAPRRCFATSADRGGALGNPRKPGALTDEEFAQIKETFRRRGPPGRRDG